MLLVVEATCLEGRVLIASVSRLFNLVSLFLFGCCVGWFFCLLLWLFCFVLRYPEFLQIIASLLQQVRASLDRQCLVLDRLQRKRNRFLLLLVHRRWLRNDLLVSTHSTAEVNLFLNSTVSLIIRFPLLSFLTILDCRLPPHRNLIDELFWLIIGMPCVVPAGLLNLHGRHGQKEDMRDWTGIDYASLSPLTPWWNLKHRWRHLYCWRRDESRDVLCLPLFGFLRGRSGVCVDEMRRAKACVWLFWPN